MRFVMLKSINGDPILVNIAAVRAVATINMAGDDVGVLSFDGAHEIVVGSSVAEVLAAIEAAGQHVAGE
jgi:hypothetical protein